MSEMKRTEQIEELARSLYGTTLSWAECVHFAGNLYSNGFRKQREGKWKFNRDGSGTCSECHFTQRGVWDYDNWQNYCGVCGAKMGMEEQK